MVAWWSCAVSVAQAVGKRLDTGDPRDSVSSKSTMQYELQLEWKIAFQKKWWGVTLYLRRWPSTATNILVYKGTNPPTQINFKKERKSKYQGNRLFAHCVLLIHCTLLLWLGDECDHESITVKCALLFHHLYSQNVTINVNCLNIVWILGGCSRLSVWVNGRLYCFYDWRNYKFELHIAT